MKKAVRAAKGTTQIIWLGVASLVGVGLLVWVGSMFLPGDDATVTDTPVTEAPDVIVFDETDMAEADEEATVVVDRGTWLMVEDRDPMDDSPRVFATLKADRATLLVGCTNGETNAFVDWGEYLGTDRTVTVAHRLPPNPAERGSWLRALEATAAPDPIALLRGIAAGTELVVRTTPYMSAPVTVTFDITGAELAIGKVAEACGWEL